jgi:drug/metabolite transporter (DMT)-like permease
MAPLPPRESHWKAGFLYALATACVWGTLPIALKTLLGPMSPQTVVWYRFGFAAVFLTIFLRLRGPLTLPAPGARRLPLLVLTVVGFAINNVTFMLGLEYISPTAAQVMIQLAPLLVVVAGVVIFGESFGGLQYVGAPMLAGGILLFFHGQLGNVFQAGAESGTGIVLIVIAAMAWASFTVVQKKLLHAYGSFRLMLLIYGVGVLLVTPLASPAQAFGLDWSQKLVLLYGCATTVVGYGLFSEALKAWDASRVGAVVAVTPLFTWGLTHVGSWIFPQAIVAERADGWSILGGFAVAIGSALAALGRGPIASAPTPAQAPPPEEADPQQESALPATVVRNQCPTQS